MTTKDELLFLKSDQCGTLYYHNVYSFYDEPLIFSALNEFDQLFFCYSLGCDETHDRWIIVPTSQDKINQLEQKDIPIIKMMRSNAQSKVIHINIDLNSSAASESMEFFRKLDYLMPSDDVFIRENINYDGKRNFSHRLSIDKLSGAEIASETLNQVSERFVEFCRSYLNKHDILVQFFPKDAVPGSFVYRLKASSGDEEQFRSTGYELLSNISSSEIFTQSLQEQEVDLRVVRKLFDLIGTKNIKVQLVDVASTQTILNLEPEYIENMIPVIDDMLDTYLDSSMVPQADNLERVKLYLNLVNESRIVTPEKLGIALRQVSYYRDACSHLSLINDYLFLTPLGSKVAASEDMLEWIPILQRQFEESDCGNKWMLNQKVDSILDIDEDSAGKFLIDNCNGLSDKTSLRRARTLTSWVKNFKEIAEIALKQ